MPSIDWSDLKKRREEVKSLYPSIRKVPLTYATKRELIRGILRDLSGSVLDVGGSGRFVGKLCDEAPSIKEYRSMDVDTTGGHDYESLSEITRTFDSVFVLDVIEHLELNEGAKMLSECERLLSPGGTIILTMPNNLHPTAFSGDVTHCTSYRYHELGALLLICGFSGLSISRVSAKDKAGHRLLARLLAPIMRFMDVDFATGILVKAKKP
ncbi:MAG: class I SAM-dependent methyltransferase [Thermodesulfobacteriota bacterium]